MTGKSKDESHYHDRSHYIYSDASCTLTMADEADEASSITFHDGDTLTLHWDQTYDTHTSSSVNSTSTTVNTIVQSTNQAQTIGWVTGSGSWTASSGFVASEPEPLICKCCDNEIQDDDSVVLEVGEEVVCFHKSCFVNPENQQFIRSIIVSEDLGLL